MWDIKKSCWQGQKTLEDNLIWDYIINTVDVAAFRKVRNQMKSLDIKLTKVDELGTLLAQISDLTAKAEAIKADLRDAATLPGAEHEFEGNLFRALVVESDRKTVSYADLVKDLKVPADVVAKYTKTSAVFSVKVTAR